MAAAEGAGGGDSGKVLEERILVLAPTGRDAALTCQLLGRAGLAASACADERELGREVQRGAGAAVLADEALSPHTVNRLLDVLGSQGPWSDLPLIVFTRPSASDEVLETLAPLGNATLLERPVRLSTLLSAVQAALRARRRQYEVRDLLLRQAEADRRKDEFLAMLGHELRNPLAAIRNALSVLDEVGSRAERAVRQREVIDRQARHLTRMVDDLLDVSRVTLGKIALKVRPVDLQVVVERCLRELGAATQVERRALRLTVRTEPVWVEGDPVRLEQVVSNLIHNAVKYTPPGGSISVEVRREGGEALVQVRDDGIGIAPEMLPSIFEPFTQVESSRARSQGGLGLGLPLVRRLAELHGGHVTAASRGPGTGSEFTVRLPARAEPPAAEWATEEEGDLRPAAGGRRRSYGLHILVIEDNLDGRETLRDLLEVWGHRVELAADGREGLARILAATPEVALIDIGLPGMDGNEVARRIRAGSGDAGSEGPTPCLIAMTGYGQPEDRQRALEAGFDAYMVKPVDPAALARLLGDLCARRQDREDLAGAPAA
jgi:two-component system, sensor histidine kinase